MQQIDEAVILLKAAVSDVPDVARQKVAVCVGQRGSLEDAFGPKNWASKRSIDSRSCPDPNRDLSLREF
jgi:hypothetical protein